MNKFKSIIFSLFFFGITTFLTGCDYAMLNPKGMIAIAQKHIMITSVLLMLIVVIPVIFLSLLFAWRYRETNAKASYQPNWSHSILLEIICWSIPCIIIVFLGAITWTTSHTLDPYRPLTSAQKPLVIQAIALEWKWLFIYPEENIASVNYVSFPVNRPIQFLITSEGPMNSLHIPQLGGQIYAMAGMQTKLHLLGNELGQYRGMSANFSGDGFSSMKFIAEVRTEAAYTQWIKHVQQSARPLTQTTYEKLKLRSENAPIQYFSAPQKDLFATVMMKYMMPINQHDMTAPTQQHHTHAQHHLAGAI